MTDERILSYFINFVISITWSKDVQNSLSQEIKLDLIFQRKLKSRSVKNFESHILQNMKPIWTGSTQILIELALSKV